ncbi:MAG: multiheme c-type cytochrome, partial [Planctomycetota bacterium]|nr:multiheme c-type cytochrome [Planctomycetota bacterium]
MIRNTIAIFFLFFLGTLSLTSCGRQEKEKKRDRPRVALNQKKFKTPKPVPHDYVGSEACRECHADIMKEYESHPMSRSMSVTLASEIEDYEKAPEFAAGPNASYAVTRYPKKIEHRETITDSSGQPISEHGETIDFTCGSGERGCSYFVFREGKLFQSPVTWYAKRGKWDLSPGYDPKHHPRFERMASDGCLACHAGRMNPVENERGTFDAKTPFHELSIGCERCHGPAKSHIEFHQSKSTGSGEKDPIVNPVKLAPELRDAVCYQCHLQGENRVARYGRTEYDFRPGMHVSDVWITFLKSGATSEGKADAVSQVEQMQQSECFIQSQGALGCISCHDPHRSPSADQRVDFYRNQCTKCHSQEAGKTECSSPLDERTRKSPTNSCIQCHMPKLNAGDVPHTPQTDHRVQVPGDSFEYRDNSEDGFRIWNDRKVPNHAIERAKTIASAEQAFMMSDIQKADRALEGLRYFHPVAKDDLPLQDALAQL